MTTDQRKHPLIVFLEEHADDRAMLAALRRGLGRESGDASEMYPYVLPFVTDTRQEANLFYIASLFALHPVSAATGNMGNHLRAYADLVQDDTATTRRFVQLLNLHRAALDNPLRQHISLLKSKDIAVNWHDLLSALQGWSHPSHYVQKGWASRFWQSSIDPQSKSGANTSAKSQGEQQ